MSINSSTYNWYTGIGGIGMLDTAYLTYLKLTGSDAFCPVGGGTCGDVLNSDYALVFGIIHCFTDYNIAIDLRRLNMGCPESRV